MHEDFCETRNRATALLHRALYLRFAMVAQRLRFAVQRNGLSDRELRVINGRCQAKSQDDSLFPISQVSASSTWARDSETLLTPDCAAAARAGASNLQVITSNLQGLVDINLQSTAPSLLGSLCRVTVVPFRPAHQTGETGWVSHQFGSTNVFPDAW